MGWFPKSRTNLQLESDITWAADHLGSLWSSSLRRGIGVDVTLITMANKDLLYSMGNYTQYLVIMYNGALAGRLFTTSATWEVLH